MIESAEDREEERLLLAKIEKTAAGQRLLAEVMAELRALGAVMDRMSSQLAAGDGTALRRTLAGVRRRTADYEGPAYLAAAVHDVHRERAALIVNAERDIVHWHKDPRAAACPKCRAPVGGACRWAPPSEGAR